MNPQDNPHFTAYALGELSADEARALHEVLATTPAAAHELEQIEAVTDALRHGAPIPLSRLTHEQRHAVLHPSNLPRRIQPMLPRKPAQRPPQIFWPVVGTLVKLAAVITLTGAAFLAGWSFAPEMKSAVQMAATPSKAERPVETVIKQTPAAKTTPAATVAARSAVPAPVTPAVSTPVVEKAVVGVKPATESAPATVPAVKEVPTAKVASVKEAPATLMVAATGLGFTSPGGRGTFSSTTK